MILDSWLAAYYWSEIPKDHGEFANIAIEMNGQDNYVTNVCVPSAYGWSKHTAVCLLHVCSACIDRLDSIVSQVGRVSGVDGCLRASGLSGETESQADELPRIP